MPAGALYDQHEGIVTQWMGVVGVARPDRADGMQGTKLGATPNRDDAEEPRFECLGRLTPARRKVAAKLK